MNGTSVAETGAGGAVAWREKYTPFGEARFNPAANIDDAGYTGHIRDRETGLTYMQAFDGCVCSANGPSHYYNPVWGVR